MSQTRSVSMVLAGVIFVMFFYFVSLCFSMIVFEIFDIQEKNIWKIVVCTFIGLIALSIYASTREEKNWIKHCAKLAEKKAAESSKFNLIAQATYFSGSRKDIADNLKRESYRVQKTLSSKNKIIDSKKYEQSSDFKKIKLAEKFKTPY